MSARRVLRAGGLWFDGRSNSVVVPVSSSLTNFTEKSVAFWMRPSAYTPIWEPYDHGYWVSPFGDLFQNIYSALIYFLKNTDGASVSLRYDLPAELQYKWIHVATSWDGSTAKLYVNAVKRVEAAFSGVLACSAYSLTIGSRYILAYPFNGIIDDVRIYNRALSDGEIKAIYERDELIKNGLVLYLDFTEYEGNIAYDKSGMGNHGTIYGGARWVIKKAL